MNINRERTEFRGRFPGPSRTFDRCPGLSMIFFRGPDRFPGLFQEIQDSVRTLNIKVIFRCNKECCNYVQNIKTCIHRIAFLE